MIIMVVHILRILGYYGDGAAGWKGKRGVDFGSSVRFEVYSTEMSAFDSLDSQP